MDSPVLLDEALQDHQLTRFCDAWIFGCHQCARQS